MSETTPVDIAAVMNTVALAQIAGTVEKVILSKIAGGRSTFSMAEVEAYMKNPGNPNVRALQEARTKLTNYLLTLSLETLCDIRGLMWLGRNGPHDGVEIVPIHQRLNLYRTVCSEDKRDDIAYYVVSKSPALYEYLTTGLRLIGLEAPGDD